MLNNQHNKMPLADVVYATLQEANDAKAKGLQEEARALFHEHKQLKSRLDQGELWFHLT